MLFYIVVFGDALCFLIECSTVVECHWRMEGLSESAFQGVWTEHVSWCDQWTNPSGRHSKSISSSLSKSSTEHCSVSCGQWILDGGLDFEVAFDIRYKDKDYVSPLCHVGNVLNGMCILEIRDKDKYLSLPLTIVSHIVYFNIYEGVK